MKDNNEEPTFYIRADPGCAFLLFVGLMFFCLETCAIVSLVVDKL